MSLEKILFPGLKLPLPARPVPSEVCLLTSDVVEGTVLPTHVKA